VTKRGAGGSQGKTSLTGRGETNDYISVTGFLVYYLQHMATNGLIQHDKSESSSEYPDHMEIEDPLNRLQLFLAGYSYGSLVLARLPPITAMIQRFQDAELGTAPAEIILRAHAVAKQTLNSLKQRQQQTPTRPRGRTLSVSEMSSSPSEPRPRPSPVTIGGEETNPSDRRRSRDARRRSADFVRRSVELPARIERHVRKGSDKKTKTPPSSSGERDRPGTASTVVANAVPVVDVRYLLISPVLIPFTTTLAPPGASMSFSSQNGGNGMQFTKHPALAVFGTADVFTAARRLRAWAERTEKESSSFTWKQVEGADHFWRERDAMRALQEAVAAFVAKRSSSIAGVER
jgi:hypothetical protein